MDSQQHHGETERKEGLGGRVHRFVDTELSRVLDKEDRSADHGPTEQHREAERAADLDRAAGSDRTYESDRDYETERAYETERVAHREPVTTYPDVSERADPPMTAPVDSGHPPPPTPEHERVEEAGTGPLGGRSSDQAAADAGAERVGLLDDPASLRDQWQQVQGTFVDDPRCAVREAGELVERTLQEIRANVTRGQAGDPTSTEDLRVSFQRYREFFQRLLSA